MMIMLQRILLAAVALLPGALGFSLLAQTTSSRSSVQCQHSSSSTRLLGRPQQSSNDDEGYSTTTTTTTTTTRSQFLQSAAAGVLLGGTVNSKPALAAEPEATSTATTMFQLPSGVKYLDLRPGSGPTPEYGQLCTIAYKGYIKLPPNKDQANPPPQAFDASAAYLLKHGNGRTIAGLDEGLHTLQLGGQRRIIIPPKLGYVSSGLGPIPEYPWDRARLNGLLDDMIKYRGGTVVFEVTLLKIRDDEADQGYYQDGSLTPEQFAALQANIQQRAAAAAAGGE